MKKNKLQILVGIVLSCLVVATVFSAIKATKEGQTLIMLENKANELSQENQDLNHQIVQSSSLSHVAKQAQSLGMTQPENFIYMNEGSVAVRGANQVASLP